ncbi:MAG: cupin domain-containing protein [Chloroflexaceae bacterium]|nr:cupin domain-containing protein [Chloroflexaceae bacterium]
MSHTPETTTDKPTCRIVRPGETYDGQQGLTYFAGIAAETVGSVGICMHMVRIPPGAWANAHLHAQHETAIYMLSGETEMWYGEGLEQHLVLRAGEFLYIPANMPHQPFNPTTSEAVAVLARTDPNEQESVRLLPELDGRHRPSR